MNFEIFPFFNHKMYMRAHKNKYYLLKIISH